MYPFTHFFLWLCLGALWLRLSTPSPVRVSVPISPSNTPNVEEFLLRYGYLGETDRNSINLLSADGLRDAIIEMQKFANLEPTGVADNTTLALMSGMRCGIPDIIHSSQPHKRRFKRYFLQGSKWNRTALTWRSVVRHSLLTKNIA
ncbi:unnamed protein product [Oppiella nova]|uniref:Peptidoglycan binding-like domain-containing protein n=1 Tax=Oppiella nova TaxID=334625 RepID=A0A7R9LYZ4_9ACAR|nr:unnamed protein product [Oppiella nova]CAG2167712.1 unnamed protein product [Oppiella nova]